MIIDQENLNKPARRDDSTLIVKCITCITVPDALEYLKEL